MRVKNQVIHDKNTVFQSYSKQMTGKTVFSAD